MLVRKDSTAVVCINVLGGVGGMVSCVFVCVVGVCVCCGVFWSGLDLGVQLSVVWWCVLVGCFGGGAVMGIQLWLHIFRTILRV